MKPGCLIVVLLSLLGFGSDFERAKLLDVQASTEAGTPMIAPNNGHPVLIQSRGNIFTITVGMGGMSYSAQYRPNRHFKPSELIVGDSIEARIDGDKLILRSKEGKEEKAKITRRERLATK